MALPPSIPTSFVPKQPVAAARKRVSGANPFLALAYAILGIAVFACAAIFGYQYFLEGVAERKANEVTVAQNSIDQAKVIEFIRLRDRFSSAQNLLDHQVALSQFFDVLERQTLQNVNFHTLEVLVADDRRATIEMTGTARNFNALAAQSAAFATDKRIKRTIFSGITVGQGGVVTFNLSAELDPELVERSPESVRVAPPPATPVATTTPLQTGTSTQRATTTQL